MKAISSSCAPLPFPHACSFSQGAIVTEKYILSYEAHALPQISLVQEDEPGTPET